MSKPTSWTWTDSLRARYPDLLERADLSVPLGWADLVTDLVHEIASRLSVEERAAFRVTQVKEKYGGLRFYADGCPDWADDMVDMAEAKSETVCEIRGSPGRWRSNGWLTTRCDHPTASGSGL